MKTKKNKIRSVIGGIVLTLVATACASTEKAKEATKESIDQNAREISQAGVTQASLDNLTTSWGSVYFFVSADLMYKIF